jgi:YHS domain-containing protein
MPTNRNLPQLPPGVPPLALDGHCPVTLMNLGKWEKGDPRFGVVHRDRTYLFKSQIERDRFLAPAAADRFAPVLSGLDPVRFAETGQAVDGRREHGVLFDGQIYLFADEDALVRFEQQPQRYVAVVRQAMANARNVPPQR